MANLGEKRNHLCGLDDVSVIIIQIQCSHSQNSKHFIVGIIRADCETYKGKRIWQNILKQQRADLPYQVLTCSWDY